MSTRERSGGESAARGRPKDEPEVEVPVSDDVNPLNLKTLKDKKVADLAALAKDMNIDGTAAMR